MMLPLCMASCNLFLYHLATSVFFLLVPGLLLGQLDTVLYQVLPITVVAQNFLMTMLIGLLFWAFPKWTLWHLFVLIESIVKPCWADLIVIWMIRPILLHDFTTAHLIYLYDWPQCFQVRVEECPVPFLRPGDVLYCLDNILHWVPGVLFKCNPPYQVCGECSPLTR